VYKLEDVCLYCVRLSQSLALVQGIIVENKIATKTLGVYDLSYSPLLSSLASLKWVEC